MFVTKIEVDVFKMEKSTKVIQIISEINMKLSNLERILFIRNIFPALRDLVEPDYFMIICPLSPLLQNIYL